MGAHAIGRFEIEGEAGSGAAGTVYQARDRVSGARVAVKVLRGLSVADTARFSREARLLAQIRHPGVVRYVDHGATEEGSAYLVMEWLDGEDVRRRLGRVGMSVDEGVQLGRRVAEALAAIHGLGVVHRDIKPANIFLPGGSIGDAKIIDFGLVHGEWTSVEVTRTGMVVGTPAYMSPEQARGQRTLDARADLFSLGCVLFKCLTGRPPFEGASVLAVLTKVLLDEAPRPRSLRPEIPPALEDLVMRLMRKERDERPPSAAAVASALAAIAPVGDDGGDIEPAPSSRLGSGLTTGERRVSAVLLVGAPAAGAPEGPGVDAVSASATYAAKDADAGASSIRALVEAHGAHLDSIVGGARVVTLASPGVATDHAARVARLALALRDALPDAPMAIATGRSEVGRRQTSGDAIERAAGLLADQVAALDADHPPEIAVDAVTAALLDPRFEVVSGRAPGGLGLLGMRPAETAARTLLGRPTPLVGREWELGSIESIFHACVDEGEARALLVTAPAGVGKSRLAHEAVGALRRACPETEVWWGRGDALRAGSALGLLGQVVRSAARVREGEPPDAQRRRFAERVAVWTKETWVAEMLGEIAGVPFPDEGSPALRAARQEPRIMSESVYAAWEALVAGAAAAGPLVVVLEDLHWADPATVRFVGAALASLERRPWLLLALARPEVHEVFHRLWEGRSLQVIRLAPLTRRASERLARQVLGEAAGSETIERIAAQADGNAFYLEELIRAVSDARRAGAPLEGIGKHASALPETVLAMVQARLEGLDAGTRRILRAASVFGPVFWAGGVTALLGIAEADAGWVADLEERELVVSRPESRFPGELELAFRHALLREGAYATLTEADRELGHALAGSWLEAHGEGDSMLLAHHFELARDEARAARHHRAAALSALRAADIDAAIACAERARARAPTEAERAECLALLCEAYAWRDDQGRALACALEVEQLAAPGSEPWVRAMAMKQSAALMLGRIDELGSAVVALSSVEPAAGTAAVMAPALTVTVFLLCFGLQISMAEAVLAKLAAVAGSAGAGEHGSLTLAPLELARIWVAAWGHGDAWAALGHARLARLHGEASRDARHTRFARVFAATSLWALGQLPEAEAELRAAGPVSADDLIGTVATLYLALVLVERGALDEARALAAHRIETGRAGAERLGALREAEGHWLLGEIAAREGDLVVAEREILAGVELLRPAVLVWQLATARLVDVRLRRGAVAEALALARELEGTLAASGGHGLRGTLVRLLHAEALHAAGEVAAAHAALRAAWGDLQARAALIDDPEARRRFLDEVPENARVAALARAWLG